MFRAALILRYDIKQVNRRDAWPCVSVQVGNRKPASAGDRTQTGGKFKNKITAQNHLWAQKAYPCFSC